MALNRHVAVKVKTDSQLLLQPYHVAAAADNKGMFLGTKLAHVPTCVAGHGCISFWAFFL